MPRILRSVGAVPAGILACVVVISVIHLGIRLVSGGAPGAGPA